MRTLAGEDRLLFRVVRDGGGWTAMLVVVALAGAAAELALPAVLGLAVDAAVGGDASRGGRWSPAAWSSPCWSPTCSVTSPAATAPPGPPPGSDDGCCGTSSRWTCGPSAATR
ncbi:hypothetical protein GCM10029963_06800 [Micromonospora andamanensis]